MTQPVGLQIVSSGQVGTVILVVSGEVDVSNADQLERAIATAGAPAVVVNLAGLAYLDSAGMRALDRGARGAREGGATVRLVCPSESVAGSSLRVAGHGDDIVSSVEAALACSEHGAS